MAFGRDSPGQFRVRFDPLPGQAEAGADSVRGEGVEDLARVPRVRTGIERERDGGPRGITVADDLRGSRRGSGRRRRFGRRGERGRRSRGRRRGGRGGRDRGRGAGRRGRRGARRGCRLVGAPTAAPERHRYQHGRRDQSQGPDHGSASSFVGRVFSRAGRTRPRGACGRSCRSGCSAARHEARHRRLSRLVALRGP